MGYEVETSLGSGGFGQVTKWSDPLVESTEIDLN